MGIQCTLVLLLSSLVAPYHLSGIIFYSDCPESVPAFLGSPGELIEGHVEPPLPNVTVVLDLGGDGQVTTYTDKSGHYRLTL